MVVTVNGIQDAGQGVGGEVDDFITGLTTGEKPDYVSDASPLGAVFAYRSTTAFDCASTFLVVPFEFGDGMFGVELD